MVAEKGTGLILGAQLFEAGAAENIHLALAMRAGMTTAQFRGAFVFVYPTFSSALSSTVPAVPLIPSRQVFSFQCSVFNPALLHRGVKTDS